MDIIKVLFRPVLVLVLVILSLVGLVKGLLGQDWLMAGAGGSYLAGMILFFKGRTWGRLLCGVGVAGLVFLSVGAFKTSPVLAGIGCFLGVAGIWALLKVRSRDEDEPLISMVLLLSKPMYADVELLKELFGKVLGEEITTIEIAEDEQDPESKFPKAEEGVTFIGGRSPLYMVGCEKGMFMVHDHSEPYMEDKESAAEEVRELRASHAIRDHEGWVAVDFMGEAESEEHLLDLYAFIGKLLAELADYAESNSLAIFIPDKNHFFPYDAEMLEKLRSEEAIQGLMETTPMPVVQISDDDERMKAAVAEARETFPEFREAFENRREGQWFGIKAPVTSAGNTEFVWLEVEAIEGDQIMGELNNDPVELPGIKIGAKLTIDLADLNDWTLTEGEEMKGGYTMKVLIDAHREASGGGEG